MKNTATPSSRSAAHPLEFLIEQYQDFIRRPGYNETYKWEIFRNFRTHWDPEAPDFTRMLEQAISHRIVNLWQSRNYFPRKMLLLLAGRFPEAVRAMFRALADETQTLEQRIPAFRAEALRLQRLIDPGLQVYQDNRAVMLYLCLLYPERYFLFKASTFRNFCLRTGFWKIPAEQSKDVGLVSEYQDMCHALRDRLQQHAGLIDAYRHSERTHTFADPALTLLTQDFIYVVAEQLGKYAGQAEENSPEYRALSDHITYWLLAPGEGTDRWDDFYRQGYAAIDLAVGDLSDLTAEQIRAALKKGDAKTGSRKNEALGGYEFARVMREGDVVIVGRDTRHYLGWGIVRSPYYFEENARDYPHRRRVAWIEQGEWTAGGQHAPKALTNLSQYPDYLEEVKSILSINVSPIAAVEEETPARPVYTETDARQALFLADAGFDQLLRVLRQKKNVVLQGPPGVGKTFAARWIARALLGRDDDRRIVTVQFHQSYGYEDFIQGIRPSADGGFAVRKGIFYTFCERAQRDPRTPHFFLIDEINRGNLSRIFGELLLLLEPDKRGREHRIALTYSEPGEYFYIPENVYLIGTMNTADRSLAMVDYALRRRFAFFELEPVFGDKLRTGLERQGVEPAFIRAIFEKMDTLNRVIGADQGLDNGFRIGHSYFSDASPVAKGIQTARDWYLDVVETEIVPLLQEYWFDQPDKAREMAEMLRSL